MKKNKKKNPVALAEEAAKEKLAPTDTPPSPETEESTPINEEASTEQAAAEKAALPQDSIQMEASTEETAEKAPEKEPAEDASTEESTEEASTEENNALPATVEEEKAVSPLKIKQKRKTDEPMSDEEAYQVLGPQSLQGHLLQLVLAPIPYLSLLFTFLWISLGGTRFSVTMVALAGAAVLAIFAAWALGGSTNVNRRRFARAYFLSLLVIAAAGALFALLAISYGADLSPVLRRIMNVISSL